MPQLWEYVKEIEEKRSEDTLQINTINATLLANFGRDGCRKTHIISNTMPPIDKLLRVLRWYEEERVKPIQALRTLITAAKAMPEHSHTPAQMALDDAIEAAEEVMKEVE